MCTWQVGAVQRTEEPESDDVIHVQVRQQHVDS
jgi:hypothetical protein